MATKKKTAKKKATMTTEELKAAVRAYNDEHHPGWKCSSVSIRVGEVRDVLNEMLLVMPDPAPQSEPLSVVIHS